MALKDCFACSFCRSAQRAEGINLSSAVASAPVCACRPGFRSCARLPASRRLVGGTRCDRRCGLTQFRPGLPVLAETPRAEDVERGYPEDSGHADVSLVGVVLVEAVRKRGDVEAVASDPAPHPASRIVRGEDANSGRDLAPGRAAWSGLVRGSCRHLCLSPVRLEHDFDAAVFLVAERLIHVGPILESDPVRNYERRIDFSSLDAAQ